MSSFPSNLQVQHDPGKQEFYIELPDLGSTSHKKKKPKTAVLQYVPVDMSEAVLSGNGCDKDQLVLDLCHTFVPAEYNGQGIGKILAKAAMDHCYQNNIKVILTCSFLEHFLNKCPADHHYSDIVLKK